MPLEGGTCGFATNGKNYSIPNLSRKGIGSMGKTEVEEESESLKCRF